MEVAILKKPFQPIRVVLLIVNGGSLWSLPFSRQNCIHSREANQISLRRLWGVPLIFPWGSIVKLPWMHTVTNPTRANITLDVARMPNSNKQLTNLLFRPYIDVNTHACMHTHTGVDRHAHTRSHPQLQIYNTPHALLCTHTHMHTHSLINTYTDTNRHSYNLMCLSALFKYNLMAVRHSGRCVFECVIYVGVCLTLCYSL